MGRKLTAIRKNYYLDIGGKICPYILFFSLREWLPKHLVSETKSEEKQSVMSSL